jgi:hypothetical protein
MLRVCGACRANRTTFSGFDLHQQPSPSSDLPAAPKEIRTGDHYCHDKGWYTLLAHPHEPSVVSLGGQPRSSPPDLVLIG